jgi:hypothetical protein
VADYLSQLATNEINGAYCFQRLGNLDEGLRRTAQVLLIREQLARNFPEIQVHAQKVVKTRQDLAGSATLYIDREVPLAAELPAAEKFAAQTKRRDIWQRWRDEFPSVEVFRVRWEECDAEIKKLESRL